MRKFTICCLCAFLGMSPARSEDHPRLGLKDVSLVNYHLVSGMKDRCVINVEAWNTAIDFVANQSNKLKLIRWKEHFERDKELADKVRELSDKASEAARKIMAPRTEGEFAAATKALDEAAAKSSKYSAAPSLLLVVEGFEHNGSCVGNLSATVSAMLKPSEMIATGQPIHHPSQEIWSRSTLLAGPTNTFSRFVIESSEEMVKSFVNDWALSQEVFR